MSIRISNPYYFIAGILAMLFAVTHAWNGQSAVLPKLGLEAITADIRIVFTYVWHIITAENLVFGVAFIFMSVQGSPTASSKPSQRMTRFEQGTPLQGLLATVLIVSILLVRLLVILGITAALHPSALPGTVLDSVVIVIYILLIIRGIKMKSKFKKPIIANPEE